MTKQFFKTYKEMEVTGKEVKKKFIATLNEFIAICGEKNEKSLAQIAAINKKRLDAQITADDKIKEFNELFAEKKQTETALISLNKKIDELGHETISARYSYIEATGKATTIIENYLKTKE